jgi:maltose alpha-D-glucosyltransferase/alpha-amylase
MLGNDRTRLELAFSLLLALPGTPMIQYGDEIGMGDDLSLPEREAARTLMQWTDQPNAGFSVASKTVAPAIDDPVYGYESSNVAKQRRDPGSLLNCVERMLRERRECPEIGWGDCSILRGDASNVLLLKYDLRGTALITLHNFSGERRTVRLQERDAGAPCLVDVFGDHHSTAGQDSVHRIELEPYGYRWLRVSAADTTLRRAPF